MSTLELPRVTLADAAAGLLCVLGASCLEAVLRHYPGATPGVGIAAGLLTLAWLCLGTLHASRSLRTVAWRPDGTWLLRFRDDSSMTARLGPATRVLGRSLVLDWQAEERSITRLLTRWDVDGEALRATRVRLGCNAGLRPA